MNGTTVGAIDPTSTASGGNIGVNRLVVEQILDAWLAEHVTARERGRMGQQLQTDGTFGGYLLR
jgi:hypothetical protein